MHLGIKNRMQSELLRNSARLLSANVIAQALGILVYPILTRLYSPEDFGLLNLFMSIGGVLVLLATLEWYNAIVLPQKEIEARAMVHLCFISIGVLTVILLITIPFSGYIAQLFKSPRLTQFYWLMPLYVLLMSLWNVLNYWYIRNKAYNRISGYQISQSLFSAGYKAGFGVLGWTSGGLIWGSVLSPLCSLILSLSLSAKMFLRQLLVWDWRACKETARKYSNFPKYATPRVLLNNIVGQLPVFVLTPLFGSRLIGFWGMALMLAFVPVSTVSRALYQVFYQNTTERVNAGESIAPFYRKFTVWSLGVIVPAFILLWFVLPALTAWLLGDEWSVTGEYIRWMLPWLACSILCGSTGYLVDIFFKQKTGLLFEILQAVSRIVGVGIGIAMNSFEIAICGYAVGSAVVNAAQYIWYLSLIQTYEKGIENAH